MASLTPELAPLEAAQFPISGTLTTRLDLAARSGEGVRADLRFGAGWLKSELLPEGALRLEQGSLHAVYAPENNTNVEQAQRIAAFRRVDRVEGALL